MKNCNNCKTHLPVDSFGSDKSRKDGKSIYCLQCRAELARTARYSKPERGRTYARYKRYGITKEEYDRLNTKQGGLCAICGTDTPGRNHQTLYIDHDHSTGKVRGLLCCDCNLLLGYAKDNKTVLLKSIKYLEERGEPSQP
jgi:hypothetical protein